MFLPDNITAFPVRSVLYAIPYLCLALLTLFCCPITHKITRNNRRLLFVIICYILFFGLRWHILSDSMSYESDYLNLSNATLSFDYIWSSKPVYIDIGYHICMVISNWLGLDYFTFQFINSLFDFYLLYICIKKYSINPGLSLLLFLAFGGIFSEINLLRNIKVILIFLYSISYIKERNWRKYFLLNCLSLTIHSSSALYIPLYWLLYRRFNAKIILITILGSTLISVFCSQFVFTILSDYIGRFSDSEAMVVSKMSFYLDSEAQSIISLSFFERIGTFILAFIMYHKGKQNDNYILFFNSFLIYYVFYALFGFNQTFRDRFPILFSFSYWFLYPYIVNYFAPKYKYFTTMLIVFFLIKIMAVTSGCAAYYETVLFHQTTAKERQYLVDKEAFNQIE